MALAAHEYAGTLTLEAFQSRVRQMLEQRWSLSVAGEGRPT
jgi:hypothetical protein